jgi:hypothetical protein
MHECRQCAPSICHVSGCHGNGMRQPLCIHHNMALDSRYLFPSVISFAFRAICILDALCINDAKRRLFFATKADADRANLIFLMPAPAGLTRLPPPSHSSGKNTHTPYSIWGIRWAAFATGNRFSIHTKRRRTLHTNRFFAASSFFARFPEFRESFQTGPDLCRLDILFSSLQFTHLLAVWQKIVNRF